MAQKKERNIRKRRDFEDANIVSEEEKVDVR